MADQPKTIELDGVKYIRQDSIAQPATKVDGLEYVICRTYSAGVFAGYLKAENGQEVTLIQARRIWRWVGAATLSQLAMDGTSNPSGCKFPCEVPIVTLKQVTEIIPCTEKAKQSIGEVAIWRA